MKIRNGWALRQTVLRSVAGFTLIEIIAVMIILGVLAAVAIPKYVDMQAQARQNAAQGQANELKGTLSHAYAKAFMVKRSQPTGAEVIVNAGFTNNTNTAVGTAPDIWGVRLSAAANNITINIINRNGDANWNDTDYWNVPQ